MQQDEIAIEINGEIKKIPAHKKLQTLVDEISPAHGFFSIALNEKFIPKSDYAQYTLAKNDRVEVVIPRPGG